MKTIEIRIDGYKIVISDENKPEEIKEKETEKITYIPYPVNPTTPQYPDWWNYPYVTWTHGDVTITNTNYKPQTPIRDAMTGKDADDGNSSN